VTDQRYIALVSGAALGLLLAYAAACSGSPPPTAQDLQTAVNLSRDACQRLLDVTEAPLPEADGGAGGGP